ncbi:hypothetical protein HPO96_24820 [Kribbella sandramycini]|uniref:Uncharacterized protein n=1 Tax=Kribbella sandramycini TaxID=60450 RepID=A0A7Y4P0S8_9ACTN|nr:hypothetical protein [Kribbella sandramycini]MBB6571120.1 hypothetical protein [Kribbella sandramycini]NOL43472.1 hypothetical protein [Kribbella sandramycini]
MSSIVPGPQKKLEQEMEAARAGEKALSAGDLSPTAPKHTALTGLEDWPDALRATVEADYERNTALDTGRRRTADKHVPDLVTGLLELLDQIDKHLQATKPGLLRKGSTAEAPSAVLAELLGLPTDAVEAPPGRSEHRDAARTIKSIRDQLKSIEIRLDPLAKPIPVDHAKLTRQVTFVVRLALILEQAPAAAALIPAALDHFAEGLPDPQWEESFAEKLEFWQETYEDLAD